MKALINYYWTDDMNGDDLYKEVIGTPADIDDAILSLEENGAEILDVTYADEEGIILYWYVFGKAWKTSMPAWVIEEAKKCRGVKIIIDEYTGEVLWAKKDMH